MVLAAGEILRDAVRLDDIATYQGRLQFQNLLMYEYMPDKSERNVAAQLGINPYFVKDYVAAAKRYPAGKTFRIIGYFREIDARVKGINNPSAKDADLWKELIYKIMH